jgi:hypothetical protein
MIPPLFHEASFFLELVLQFDSSQQKPQLFNAAHASSGITIALAHVLPVAGYVALQSTVKQIILTAVPPGTTAPSDACTAMARTQQTLQSASYAHGQRLPPFPRHRNRKAAKPAQRQGSEFATQLAVA